MSRTNPSPRIRELAKRLLFYEAGTAQSSWADMTPGSRVGEKLHRHLGRLIGIAGFRMLHARALTLAKAQAPVLGTVQINLDGSLDGMSNPGNEEQAVEANVVLIAHLLTLLINFVGDDITLSLVQDVWPDFSASDQEILEKK